MGVSYYSYLWLRSKDGTFPVGIPYYAGKGSGNRAYIDGNHMVKCPKDPSHILIFPWNSETEAFESEKRLIAMFGRIDLGTGCLRNMTDGGDGSSGLRFSDEWRAQRSKQFRGEGNPFYGKTHSEETRRKFGAKLRGRKHSNEAKEKMSRTRTGHETSTETREKISKSVSGEKNWNFGRPRPADMREKISKTLKGRPWSEARRAAYERSLSNGNV